MDVTLNRFHLIFGVYLFVIFIWTVAQVGTVVECSGEPFDWQMPFGVAFFLIIPYLLGYLSKED